MFIFISALQCFTIMTGLFCLRKKRPVILLWLLALVVVATINEVIIVPNTWSWWHIAPNVFYNIFSLFDIVVWMAFYISIFRDNRMKRTVLITGILILIFSCVEIFYVNDITHLHFVTLMWFSLVCIVFSLLYFFLIYKKEVHQLNRDPKFWVCAAAFCFNTIFFVNLLTMNQKLYWNLSNAVLIFDILQSLAVTAYYILLCTAFIISYYRCRQTFRPASS